MRDGIILVVISFSLNNRTDFLKGLYRGHFKGCLFILLLAGACFIAEMLLSEKSPYNC